MKIRLFTLSMTMMIGAASVGAVHAQNAVLATELTKVFEAHNAAVKAKDVDKALAMRASAFKRNKHFDKKPDAMLRQMYLAYTASVTPESYQVEYAALEDDKQKATLGIVAKLPDMDGKVKQRIVNFEFVNEKGTWKLGEHVFWLVDVDGLKHPKSTSFEPKSAYTGGRWDRSGRIIKTTFNADHTLVILREGEKDNAVFLPAKGALGELKLTPEDLEPGNRAQFAGSMKKGDELKVWATSGEKWVGFSK